MLKTAEYVSLGHPDKIADFMSSYILDALLKNDPNVKFALEVMVKNNTVILGGEVSSYIQDNEYTNLVKNALREIGYDENYNKIWGDKAIDINKLSVINLVGTQSSEILQGVQQSGWGDQGVFVGYACKGDFHMPLELVLAKKLNDALYQKAKHSKVLGLDIKTQITINEAQEITTAIVAIPMLEDVDLKEFCVQILQQSPKKLIINGTGTYQCHSSVADCGITGRKLACDFYSTACPIGGGSPWTKDASKADLTLNLFARKLAKTYLKENDECFVYLSSCIGKAELPSATVKTIKDGVISEQNISINLKPYEIIDELGLKKPVFASLCKNGLMFS